MLETQIGPLSDPTEKSVRSSSPPDEYSKADSLGDSHHFRDAGDALPRLFKTALPERLHPLLNAVGQDVAGAGPVDAHPPDGRVGHQELVNARSAGIASVPACAAAY